MLFGKTTNRRLNGTNSPIRDTGSPFYEKDGRHRGRPSMTSFSGGSGSVPTVLGCPGAPPRRQLFIGRLHQIFDRVAHSSLQLISFPFPCRAHRPNLWDRNSHSVSIVPPIRHHQPDSCQPNRRFSFRANTGTVCRRTDRPVQRRDTSAPAPANFLAVFRRATTRIAGSRQPHAENGVSV